MNPTTIHGNSYDILEKIMQYVDQEIEFFEERRLKYTEDTDKFTMISELDILSTYHKIRIKFLSLQLESL